MTILPDAVGVQNLLGHGLLTMSRIILSTFVFCSFVVTGTACDDKSKGDPSQTDAAFLDAGESDGGEPDAGDPDGGDPDAGNGVHTPPLTVAELPAGPDDVIWLGPADTMDFQIAITEGPGDCVRLVFDSGDELFERLDLFEVSGCVDVGFGEFTRVEGEQHKFRSSPSFVGDLLYFQVGSTLYASPTLYELGADGERALPSVSGVDSTLSWPRFAPHHDGVALAFRDGNSMLRLALGDGPDDLGTPVLVHSEPGAMPVVAPFGASSTMLAYAFQYPVGHEPMVSFVVMGDGEVFGEPQRVTDSSPNVHDTALVPRVDGGLDLYYIYPFGPSGFVLHRRSLSPDGTLGVEERLTASTVGEPSKPSALRLESGRVLVAFSDITERDPSTFVPIVQRVGVMLLAGEAPAPE